MVRNKQKKRKLAALERQKNANPGESFQKRAKTDDFRSAANGTAVRKSTKPKLDRKPFPESPTAEERKHEAALYDLLGSEDGIERIEAADCIVSGLLGGDGVPEKILERHLGQRLFRGLASGRNASRIGFSLVITEILGQLLGKRALSTTKYPGLSFEKVLDMLVQRTTPAGNISGFEERDHYFGQLFGLECFVKANVLFTPDYEWPRILELLLELPNKKVWLREQCAWVIVQAIPQMHQTHAKDTLNRLSEAGVQETAEGVAIYLSALNIFPDLKPPSKAWRHPLAPKSIQKVATVLKESVNDSSSLDQGVTKTKQANSTAQLHFVWDVILAYYAKKSINSHADFETFWEKAVDETLFSKNASNDQKFRGFTVFQKFLETATISNDTTMINSLFSKHLMSCLMNQAAKEERFVHRAAIKSLKAIEDAASSYPDAIFAMVKCLLGKRGAFNFDLRTNTKTVEKILQYPIGNHGGGIIELIRGRFLSAVKQDLTLTKSYGLVYTTYISKLIYPSTKRNQLSSTAATVTDMALKELASLAYTNPEWLPDGTSNDQLHEAARSRLETAFSDLIRAENMKCLCDVVSSINPSCITLDEDVSAYRNSALERMADLAKQGFDNNSRNRINVSQALALLHAVSIFQLYNEDPDALEILLELEQYNARLNDSGPIAGDGSEFLVETLLAIVARPSKLMRQISQQVFAAFSKMVSTEALKLLTDTLAADENAGGQKALFDTADDMEVDSEDAASVGENQEDADLDSDVEFVDLSGEEASGNGSDDEESNDDEAEQLEALDNALADVLKSHRLDKDKDAEASADSSDMSDSEMIALDEKLTEVFRQRMKNRPDTKKQKKDAKETVVNFKHRVLDLLDVYVRENPLEPRALTILLPLIILVRTTTTKSLAQRSCEIILNLQKQMKKARSGKSVDTTEPTSEGEDAEMLFSLLWQIHSEASTDLSGIFAKAVSTASLIVATSLIDAKKENLARVARTYANTQSGAVLEGKKIQTSFFVDWMNWCQNQVPNA